MWPEKSLGDLQVGDDMGSTEFQVTEDMVQRYADAVEDHNPWYFEGSPFGEPIAPLILTDQGCAALLMNFALPLGMLHAKQDYHFINPAGVGKVLRSYGKIVGKEITRGRERVVVEVRTVDENGLEILCSRATASWPARVEGTG